jgi:hypothetical protein
MIQMQRIQDSSNRVGAHTSVEYDRETFRLKQAHIVLFIRNGVQVDDEFISELATVIQHENVHLILDSEFDGVEPKQKLIIQKSLDSLAYLVMDREPMTGSKMKEKYMGII